MLIKHQLKHKRPLVFGGQQECFPYNKPVYGCRDEILLVRNSNIPQGEGFYPASSPTCALVDVSYRAKIRRYCSDDFNNSSCVPLAIK